jgi:DNA topoisomerase-6 subunit B
VNSIQRRHGRLGLSRESVLIEVGLAYGGSSPAQKVSLDTLTELLAESDARSLRQFLLNTFDGIGAAEPRKFYAKPTWARGNPGRSSRQDDIARLHAR